MMFKKFTSTRIFRGPRLLDLSTCGAQIRSWHVYGFCRKFCHTHTYARNQSFIRSFWCLIIIDYTWHQLIFQIEINTLKQYQPKLWCKVEIYGWHPPVLMTIDYFTSRVLFWAVISLPEYSSMLLTMLWCSDPRPWSCLTCIVCVFW